MLTVKPMNTVYIAYHDGIFDTKVRPFMAGCVQVLDQLKPDRLYFLFSSSGGNVESGVTLYNFLRALPVKIAFHNIGSVDSIANVVFVAGEERFATSHATFLLHGSTWQLNATFDREALNQLTSMANQTENKIAAILAERTKLTESDVRSHFTQGEAKDSRFALDKGIIHQIVDPVIPAHEKLLTFNFA